MFSLFLVLLSHHCHWTSFSLNDAFVWMFCVCKGTEKMCEEMDVFQCTPSRSDAWDVLLHSNFNLWRATQVQ